MRILQILSMGYPAGGVEVGAIALKEYFSERQIESKIISSDYKPDKKTTLFSDLTFSHFNHDLSINTFFINLFNPSAYINIHKCINNFRPNIIHFRTMGEVSPSGLLACLGKKVFITIHGQELFVDKLFYWNFDSKYFTGKNRTFQSLTHIARIKILYYLFIKTIYKCIFTLIKPIFIAPSNYYKKLLSSQFKNIICIPNGVDLFNFSLPTSNTKLLFVGRLEHYKGVHVLLEAINYIKLNSKQNVHLKIVGNGTEKASLQNYVRNNNLEVEFKEWVNREELQKEYHNSLCVIIPSIWPEAFCKVGIEGMSAGRPVIGSNIGAIPEWLKDNYNGYLFQTGNSKDLAKKILLLLHLEEEKIYNLSKNSRKTAEEYSINNYGYNTIKAYKKCLLL